MVMVTEQESAIASGSSAMDLKIEVEQEVDGRWIAEVMQLPGVLAYGPSPEIAVAKVQALALRVLADRLEQGESGADLMSISFQVA
jgi:predicted RNase H-like HicB family nuclease